MFGLGKGHSLKKRKDSNGKTYASCYCDYSGKEVGFKGYAYRYSYELMDYWEKMAYGRELPPMNELGAYDEDRIRMVSLATNMLFSIVGMNTKTALHQVKSLTDLLEQAHKQIKEIEQRELKK